LPKGNAVNIPQTGRGYCGATQVSISAVMEAVWYKLYTTSS
jgi:hypothetical protein